MTMSVRTAGPADHRRIMELLDSARGLELSPEERAKRGFVQGSFDERKLAALEATTGVYVAENDGELAGFAITSPADDHDGGPPRLTVDAARAAGLTSDFFLYGPVVVDPRHSGKGVLRLLLAAVDANLADRYAHAVLFVEHTNEKSMSVHRHLGMTELTEFTNNGRNYAVFTFPTGTYTP
ncbi:GNAT family N-acetyltransferase [Saccharopolyspora sp. 5N708]|uniref:GNAT family N-acetyltransferase n=1 Tax=Saccharopolyspora sp. 5N708 TaxID=3457424 RepID=UPI003FD3FE13